MVKNRSDTLRRQHEADAIGTARKALADTNAHDPASLNASHPLLGSLAGAGELDHTIRTLGRAGSRRESTANVSICRAALLGASRYQLPWQATQCKGSNRYSRVAPSNRW